MLIQKKFLLMFRNNLLPLIFCTVLVEFSIFNSAVAKPVETSPHIFVDEVDRADWFLKGDPNIIFAGCASPLFPNKKTHYLDYKTIKYGNLPDGRFIITCEFYKMYEFAIFYKTNQEDGSKSARFMIRATVDSNIHSLEVDPVLGHFNGVDLEPFPPVGTNIIPYRITEMLYYIVKGEKYYGNLNPELFIDKSNYKDILNPYTQDLYDRCKLKK